MKIIYILSIFIITFVAIGVKIKHVREIAYDRGCSNLMGKILNDDEIDVIAKADIYLKYSCYK